MKKIISLLLAILMAFTIITPTVVSAASKKVSKPKISSVSTVSSTSLEIKWKKVTGADGYVIYQKKGSGSYEKIKTITSGKTVSYTKKSLSSGTKYTYKIKAYDKVGSKKYYSDYSSTKYTYTKPAKTTLSSVSAASSTSIKISWKKVTGADGYVIYQKKGSGSYEKVKTITSGSTTSYTKKSLSSGTKYTYKIRAYVKSNEKKLYGSYSSTKYAYTKPATPSIETISAMSSSSVKLTWSKISTADGYEIYQQKGDGNFEKIKTITSELTTYYTKYSLSSDTTYTYKVRAFLVTGNTTVYSSFSSTKSAKTKEDAVVDEPTTPEVPTEPETPTEPEVLDPNRTSLSLSSSGIKGPETVKSTSPISTNEFQAPASLSTQLTHSSTGLTYYAYVPTSTAPAEGYPIFVWMHGTGGYADPFSKNSFRFWSFQADILKNAVIIAPRWTGSYAFNINGYFSNSDDVVALVKDIVNKKVSISGKTVNIDANRIYIGGYSAGGMATFREIANNPGLFAAAVPVAGAATNTTMNNAAIKTTPIWAWIGSNDTTLGYTSCRLSGNTNKQIFDAIGASSIMRLTTMNGGSHNDSAFRTSRDRRVWSWLFQQKKGSVQTLDYTVEGYIKVVDYNGNVVMTEMDCDGVPTYDANTRTFTLTLTNSARTKLTNAYKTSGGKEFTVYYGNQPILKYTATQEVDSTMTKFVIKNAFTSSYSDSYVLERIDAAYKANKLSKTNYNEMYATNYINP